MPEIGLDKIEEPAMEEAAPEETAGPSEPEPVVEESTAPEPILEQEHIPEPPVSSFGTKS